MSGANSNQVEKTLNQNWSEGGIENLVFDNQSLTKKNEESTIRLKQELINLNEQKRQGEITAIRQEIMALGQKMQMAKGQLETKTETDIQNANEKIASHDDFDLKKLFSWTTLNAYDFFIEKAHKQGKKQSLNHKKNNFTPIDQILRFDNSSGEDDTNQKAG